MRKLRNILLALLGVIFLATQVKGGSWSPNQFIYKPAVGARGAAEKARFDTGLDRIDARLGKEIWVGDPNYGPTLPEAITAIGSNKVVLRVPAGTHTLSANLTIPENVTLQVERGAVLTRSAGDHLTINGPFIAGLYQTFSDNSTNKDWVVFDKGAVGQVYPQWWGAVPNGTTNCTNAIQAAINSIPGAYGGTVYFPHGTYYVTATINTQGLTSPAATYSTFRFIGDTAVLYTDQADVSLLKRWPPDQASATAWTTSAYIIKGLTFKGSSLESQVGIDIGATYGSIVEDCRFLSLGIGCRLSFALMATVKNCLAQVCKKDHFVAQASLGLWPGGLSTGSDSASNSTVFKSCRTYGVAPTKVGIAGMTNSVLANENFAPAAVNTTNDTITVTQNWPTDTPIMFSTTTSLPTPLLLNTVYYAINVDATTIKVAASAGGAAIDLTSQGSGTHTVGNPCLVTWTGHGLATNDFVFLSDITQANWSGLNKRRFGTIKKDDNSFWIHQLNWGLPPIDTSTYGAYVPATDPGTYCKISTGFRIDSSNNVHLQDCITEGSGPVYNILFDAKKSTNVNNFSVISHHSENTPVGADIYARANGGQVYLHRVVSTFPNKTFLDCYDQTAAAEYRIDNCYWFASGTKFRTYLDSNQSGHYEFIYNGGGSTQDPSSTTWWYNSLPPAYLHVLRMESGGFWQLGGKNINLQGITVKVTKNPNYSGATFSGLQAECDSNNAGGLAAFNATNLQATNARMSFSEVTITANGVPTQTVSGLVPAGCVVVGITARVTQAIGGATTFDVEDAEGLKWLKDVAVALGSTGDLTKLDRDILASGWPYVVPKAFKVATNLTIRGNNNFNGTGKVRLTVHYLNLTAPGS